MTTYQKTVLCLSLMGATGCGTFIWGWKLGENHAINWLGEAHETELERQWSRNQAQQSNWLQQYGVEIPFTCPPVKEAAISMVVQQKNPAEITAFMKENMGKCGAESVE